MLTPHGGMAKSFSDEKFQFCRSAIGFRIAARNIDSSGVVVSSNNFGLWQGTVRGKRKHTRAASKIQHGLVRGSPHQFIDGEKAASAYAAAQLASSPSLNMLLRSIDLNATMPPGTADGLFEGMRPHIQKLLDEKPVYQCGQCGFAAKTLHWQCPSCRRWSTIRRRPDCLPL